MYVIRYKEAKEAIEPTRRLVKISDPNLWKPPQIEEEWRQGHEIRSDAVAISVFTTGTKEQLHFHEKTWEVYQVLEGCLKVAVKKFREDSWCAVVLFEHDMLVLVPGTLHLVGRDSQHVSQVIQTPPALSDQVLIDDRRQIEAATKALVLSNQELPSA